MGAEDDSCQGECSTEMQMEMSTSHVWLEQRVVLFFRLWHMIFLCTGGMLAVIIFLCCCFKCRIPRTKQEIESDFRRRKVTRKFRRELNKMQMEEIDVKDIRSVLDKVRDKFSRKPSLNKDGKLDETENDDPKEGTSGTAGTFAMIKSRFIQMFSMFKKKPQTEPNRDEVEPNKQSDGTNPETESI